MAKKGLNINFSGEEIVYTNISKSSNGYNSADMMAKIADDTYMSVRVEWKSEVAIPGFAMDLMKYMQSNAEELATKSETYKEEIAKFLK